MDILQEMGITSHIFATVLQDAKNRDSYRYLCGCDPTWYQIYTSRRWHATDPYISYSKKFIKPIFTSELMDLSPGQREFTKLNDASGFKTGFVIPSHSGSNKRIGMLFVGLDLDPIEGEAILEKHRILLRIISQEYLDWWINKIQKVAIGSIKLSSEDAKLLKLAMDDYTAHEMGQIANLSNSQVNNRFRKINEMFGVDSKKEAAVLAMEYGLIAPY